MRTDTFLVEKRGNRSRRTRLTASLDGKDASVDFLIELLVQLFVEIVVEFLGQLLVWVAFKGVASVLRSRLGRYALGTLAGFGLGVGWGEHLSGNPTWPKLLWVSLALAAVAVVLALRTAEEAVTSAAAPNPTWRDALVPPWRWAADRLVGFAILNLAIAAGIGIAFKAAPLPG